MNPSENYLAREKHFQSLAEQLQERLRFFPLWRMLLFLLSFLLIVFGLSGDLFSDWPFVTLLSVIFFFIIVKRHRHLKGELERIELMVKLNQLARERVEGHWSGRAYAGERYRVLDHEYLEDLDLLGEGSLFQLLNTTTTRLGEDRLAAFLLDRASLEEIERRQRLVSELAERLELLQELQREGQLIGMEAKEQDPAPFLNWLTTSSLVRHRFFLKGVLLFLPLWTIGALLAFLFSKSVPAFLWLLPLLIQTFLWMKMGGAVAEQLAAVASRQRAFSLYASLFKRVEEESLEEESELFHFRSELTKKAMTPFQAMRRLQFFVDLIDVRYTPLLHIPLNMFLLWDLHCLWRLENWKAELASEVPKWFDWLGYMEALVSLATFAHEHPTFAFPRVTKEAPLRYRATALGHPLVHESIRVDNDISLTEEQPFALITGSNMSGKSTFLRAIGLNAVLAYAGSVVCATSMELSLMRVGSSMRIKDSLEQGISYFMAELYRIKRILELKDSGEPLLYLLDEILHGTNTMERRKAALSIIAQLQRAQAIGLVTTHDLELAEHCRQFGTKVQFLHFTDKIEEGKMTFDYILRRGICPSTNALELMKMIGIPILDLEKSSFEDLGK